MADSDRALEIVRCPACRATYPTRPGACPRCGNGSLEAAEIPAEGVVLAVTELRFPPPGFPPGHPLVLLEGRSEVRFLGSVEGKVPEVGEVVRIEKRGRVYVAIGPATP